MDPPKPIQWFNKNKANSAQLKLELGLSLAKYDHENHKVFNMTCAKHLQFYSEESVKPCNYFKNGRQWPFEELYIKPRFTYFDKNVKDDFAPQTI